MARVLSSEREQLIDEVLIGRTDHWLWTDEHTEYMIGLLAASIPHGIAGVTVRSVKARRISISSHFKPL